jgi:two-component system chemotaxis response regulator CheB
LRREIGLRVPCAGTFGRLRRFSYGSRAGAKTRTLILTNFAIVVIGASVGGVAAMQKLVAGLDPKSPAAYFVVLHIGARESRLASILTAAGPLPAELAQDGGRIGPGRIFIAPPDQHLLLDDSRMTLSRGPRINWTRPAIDPLFCTAARSFGPRVIGVLLTGRLNDGTAGLYDIRRHGGIAVIQDPGEAECPEMPASAFRHVAIDHCLPLDSIPPLVSLLAREVATKRQEAPFGAQVDR